MPGTQEDRWNTILGKVVPYNACYLPIGNWPVDRKAIDPVAMWLEDRWVLLRRIYGSELVQKIFMRCVNFVYKCNGVKGRYLEALQETIVSQLFRQNPRYYFNDEKKSPWVHYWDDSCQGEVSIFTIHSLVKQIGILGPIAAVFGRDFELYSEEFRITTCLVETIEKSVNSRNGTLSKKSFEKVWVPWYDRAPWQDRASSSSGIV